MAVLRRVFVTGAGGSGKTLLSRRFGLPVYEMDRGETPADLDGDWVVDGIFVWDIEQYLARADLIVWLDLPMRVTIPRILRRHVVLSVRRKNPHKGLKLLAQFVRNQPAYFRSPAKEPTGPMDWDAVTRASTEQALAPHMDRVVHITTASEARAFSRSL